jgi:hypothetical protein
VEPLCKVLPAVYNRAAFLGAVLDPLVGIAAMVAQVRDV